MRDHPIANIEYTVLEMLHNPSQAPLIVDIIAGFQDIIQALCKESNDMKSSNTFKEEVIKLPDFKYGILKDDNYIQVYKT